MKIDCLKITPSLLNAWLYIGECRRHVREAESDEISLEDKRDDASAKAYEEFLSYLKREPREKTPAMIKGIEFEEETLKGNTPASPYIKGGIYQPTFIRYVNINGVRYKMEGRLDWLKAGVIYDAKRVARYEYPKYARSTQHAFYFEIVGSEAQEFDYLIMDDAGNLHVEKYFPDDCQGDALTAISDFAEWLKANGLWETYKQYWTAKADAHYFGEAPSQQID